MPRPNRIPLFPLNVVLLPGASLPLHIFEPRYKAMIAWCLREDREFGMLLASTTAMATAGCTAGIVQKLKEYADGRMDIVTEGRAVFHLIQLLDEEEYYEGIVEYPADEPWQNDPEMHKRLADIFEKCHSLQYGKQWVDNESGDPGTLAYRMGALLPLELQKKQALLEMRSESDRRQLLLELMKAILPELVKRQHVRQSAGGNGHPSN